MSAIHLDKLDALLVIDMQVDFLPGGALGVAGGHDPAEGVGRKTDARRVRAT